MASNKDPDRGIPGSSKLKGGELTKLFSDLQYGSDQTPAEIEAAKKRKKLEDEAQAARDKAAGMKSPKISDLFK